jgi:heme-degrading monooxygenase HmoA
VLVRMWSGQVEMQDADDYEKYMRETGLRGYAAVAGNEGILMLRRSVGERVEFCMVTLWDSIDAIKAFAGDDYESAVFYSKDDEFLVEREWKVRHYEVRALERFLR